MSGITVGSVAVEIVPSAQNWSAKARAQLEPQADELGITLGHKMREGIDAGLDDIHIGAHVDDDLARAEIDALKLKVEELSHERANIDVSVNNASGVRGWLTSLVAGAVAISPAFIVAGAGIAAFAALAVPSLDKVLKYEKALGTNAAKAAQEYQGLTAGQKQLANEITALRTEFAGLSQEVQPEALMAFGAAIHQLNQFLPILVPLAQAGGKALTTLINDIGGTFNGPEGRQFFDFVSKNLAVDVSQIGATIDSLIKTFFSLTEALQPVSLGLLNVLRVGADFLSWLSRVAPPIDDVIVLAIALYKPLKALQGLEVASTFRNLAGALQGVTAASGAGGAQFGWLAGGVSGYKKLAAGAIEAAGAQKVAAAAALESGAGISTFAVGAEGAATELVDLSASEKAAAVGMGLLEAVSPVGWAIAAGVAIAGLAVIMSRPPKLVEDITKGFNGQFAALGPNVTALQHLTTTYGGVTQALHGFSGPFDGFVAQVTSGVAQAKIKNLSANLDEMGQAFGLTRTQAEHIAASLPGVTKGFEQGGAAAAQARDKFSAWAIAGARGTSAMTQLQIETAILNSTLTTSAQKATALGAAFTALVQPTLDLANASVQAKSDQVSLASALTASHDKLGKATAAERAATTATTAAVTSTFAYSKALANSGASADRAAGPLVALRNQLQAAGVKGHLAAKLIAELNAQIAALHSKSIHIDVDVAQHGGATVGLGAGTRLTSGSGHSAGGMVIPGYSPGRDTYGPLYVSPGEAILVPELTAAIGPDNINALNHAYGGGRKSNAAGFAGGGLPGGFNIGNGGGHGKVITGGLDGVTDIEIYLALTEGRSFQAKSAAGASAGEALAKEFASGQLKTLDQIKTAEQTAIKDIKDYYTGPHKDLLIGALKQQTSSLERLATKSERIATEIANMKQYAAQETQSLQGFSDIGNITGTTDATTGVTAPVTGKQIASGLAQDLATLRKFESVIKQLKKAGVSKVLIGQVIALGPVDGITYGEAILAGGQTLIKELNKDEKLIGAEETKIGHTAAEIKYGQSITKGFLSSLEKERAKLAREMHHLGDEIAEELLRALEGKGTKGHKHKGGGGGGLWVHPLSASTRASASTIGGTTHGTHGLTRGDIADIRGSLRAIENRELHLMTRQQAARVIHLLEMAPKDTGQQTGRAVAAALDGTASKAASKSRASTR